MTISIRPFRPEDAERCGAIVDATPLWRRYGLDGKQLAERLKASVEPVIVADDDGTCVGFAWVQKRGAFGRSAYLRLIAVDPDRRGGRIGEKLLRGFEDLAREVSPDAFLLVSDFNVDAQRFYKREGYEELGRIQDFVVPGVAELIYRKRLVPNAAP